jgi:hypothetical protein
MGAGESKAERVCKKRTSNIACKNACRVDVDFRQFSNRLTADSLATKSIGKMNDEEALAKNCPAGCQRIWARLRVRAMGGTSIKVMKVG